MTTARGQALRCSWPRKQVLACELRLFMITSAELREENVRSEIHQTFRHWLTVQFRMEISSLSTFSLHFNGFQMVFSKMCSKYVWPHTLNCLKHTGRPSNIICRDLTCYIYISLNEPYFSRQKQKLYVLKLTTNPFKSQMN